MIVFCPDCGFRFVAPTKRFDIRGDQETWLFACPNCDAFFIQSREEKSGGLIPHVDILDRSERRELTLGKMGEYVKAGTDNFDFFVECLESVMQKIRKAVKCARPRLINQTADFEEYKATLMKDAISLEILRPNTDLLDR